MLPINETPVRLEEFRQITAELEVLKNRIRRIIGTRHFPTDGEWKESIVRTFLRRNLPSNIKVGRGFVISSKGCSSQIDVLIYDSAKPVLFREDDLVCISPDAVQAIIEVKTKMRITKKDNVFEKISKNIKMIRSNPGGFSAICGIISIDNSNVSNTRIADELKKAAGKRTKGVIDLISLGDEKFYRYHDYWPIAESGGKREYKKWHRYQIKKCAPAYFLINIIEKASQDSVRMYPDLWYPKESKEIYLKEIIDLE